MGVGGLLEPLQLSWAGRRMLGSVGRAFGGACVSLGWLEYSAFGVEAGRVFGIR